MAINVRGFLENLFEYYSLIIIGMLNCLVIWNLNITVSTSFLWETKIDERGHEIFSEKNTGPWNIQVSPPPTCLMYAPVGINVSCLAL